MKILNLRLIKIIFDILNKIRFRSLYIYIYLFLSCSKGNFLFRLFNSIFLFNLIHFERMWSSKNFGKNMALNQPLLLSVHSTRALNVSLAERNKDIFSQPCNNNSEETVYLEEKRNDPSNSISQFLPSYIKIFVINLIAQTYHLVQNFFPLKIQKR